MIVGEKVLVQTQPDSAQPSVCVCSLHPLAAERLKDAVAAAGASQFKVRMSTTFHQLRPHEHGELLFLDGCCDDWLRPALGWQKAGGQVLLLLSETASHPGKQLRALFLGVKGVVVACGNWHNEVGQAIRTVFEEKLWIGQDVLSEYVRRINVNLRKRLETPDSLLQLTAREEQIMSLLLSGDSNKEIGNALGIAERTVKYHVSHILSKSQVSSRRELLKKVTKDEEFKGLSTRQNLKAEQTGAQAGGEI
jgi:DNA-binding CsgD family transcriptional regulator